MKYSQRELLDEGFWDLHKSPILKGIGKTAKVASGLAGGLVKGTARAMDYLAPEITNPLHRFEAGIRDVAGQTRKGYDAGSGGLSKQYKDVLLDAGYIMDTKIPVMKTGKNHVAVGYRIVDEDPKTGKPIPDTKKLSFLFDHNGNFKLINTAAQQTTSANITVKPKYRTKKR